MAKKPRCLGRKIRQAKVMVMTAVTVKKPYVVDLFCGIGGRAEGLMAEGYDVIGFDIRKFRKPYPGRLVLQDVRTLSGELFQDAAFIVASPPCQEFSKWIQPGLFPRKEKPSMELINHCFRIKRESGRPLILENVRGAVAFLGREYLRFGSFFLWGDLPLIYPQMIFYKEFSVKHRSPAQRAKIPYDLARFIGQSFRTRFENESARAL